MVKSYIGVRQAPPENETQSVTVADFMTTRLITFHPEQPMEHVMHVLVRNDISGGPVVDNDNNIVGVISEGDCLKVVVRGKYNNMPNDCGKVGDCMAKEVVTIPPEMNILEAAKMFLTLKLRRFPVIKEGKLVGQISQRDVIKAVENLRQTTWDKF